MMNLNLLVMGLGGLVLGYLLATWVAWLRYGHLRALAQPKSTLAELDRLAQVVKYTSNSVFITDTQQRITWVNEGFTRISGYSFEEAKGQTPGKLFASGKADPVVIDRLLKAAADGMPCRVEVMNKAKDGHEYWVDTEVQPMRGPDGVLTGFMEISSDITERLRAEAEVRKAETLLRESLETLDEAFVLFDPEDRLVLCNQRYKDLYELSADVMVPGNTFESIIRTGALRGQYREAVGNVDEWVAQRMRAHQQDRSQVVQTLDDGRVLRVIERRMPDGHTVGFRIDITDLVNATKAAQAAVVSKSQFLANMSHEIRTPMNAILGLLKVLQNTNMTADQQDYLSKTEGAARSLLRLINDILDFSKVEAEKMVLETHSFRLDELLSELSVILAANLGIKPIEILFDLDPAVPDALLGDAMRLSQILTNLCGNAVKFTEHGEVVLSIRLIEQSSKEVQLEFAVQDSGIGIATDSQKNIFTGFSQAEASTTRRFGGTGLGLAISTRLVALMGGELQVDSETGKGSNFHFQIRLGTLDGLSPSAPVEKMRSRRVLFVVGDGVARRVLEGLTGRLHCQVDFAATATAAVHAMKMAVADGVAFQAAFVDWRTSGVEGWRALHALCSAPNAAMPMPMVVMGTAHEREQMLTMCSQEKSAASAFVVKPVTASTLQNALNDALKEALKGGAPAKLDALQETPKELRQKPRRLNGMRLLVVEDNKINQLVAQRLLIQEGAVVSLAANGQLGVDAVAQAETPFDAVLMDLQMPVMDGFAAARAIRQDLGLHHLPVIAMTANASPADRLACLDVGMNEHVGKPFDLDTLVALLRQQTAWTGT